MRLRVPLVVVSVLALGGGGLALTLSLHGRDTVPVTTATAHRGNVVREVRAVGEVRPSEQVRVSPKISGQILSVNVKEGDLVQEGVTLAELEPDVVRGLVSQREAQLKSTLADIRAAESRVGLARHKGDQTRSLNRAGHLSDESVNEAASETHILQAELDAARQRRAQALAELAQARAQLVNTRLVAPITGTVLRVTKRVGERVRGPEFTEDVFFVVAPLQRMDVSVPVSEYDVVNLKTDQPAKLQLRALKGVTVQGRVKSIGREADAKEEGHGAGVAMFAVRISLDSLPEGLLPGMTAVAVITTGARENVLRIPVEAVAQRGTPDAGRGESMPTQAAPSTGYVAFEVQAGHAVAKPIEVGMSGDSFVEVLSGVREGEEVVTGPYQSLSTLTDGAEVEVQGRHGAPAPAAAPPAKAAER